MTTPRLRVAIIGGGLAGAAMANALVQLPNIDTHVFESAPEFSERGAAIGLSINAQSALKEIMPDAKETLKKAGAVSMNSTRLMVGSGPQAGELVFDLAGMDPGQVLHRASFLRELLAPLPKEVLHANKRLSTINPQDDGSVELSFEDGTVMQFDAVIGADGIFGSVRKHVLGDAAEKHAATPVGFWDCRKLVPFVKARKVLGENLFEIDRQYGWAGHKAFIIHDVLEDRTLVQLIVSAAETEHPKDRKRPLTRELLEETLKGWPENGVSRGIIEMLLEDDDEQYAYSQWEHRSTPTYANGHICIIGDAAHATSPWQGSGAGLALEDAMILSTLFAQIQEPADIVAAFKAFDAVRRPRGQRVIDSSRGTGVIMTGQDPEMGLDAKKLAEGLGSRWGFIMGLDMAEHKKEAVERMGEFQAS